ncbi:hypothetical protein SAMN02910456_01852 [Ruminococcaceae bacterium YRB3002]|nr:hypothetical protein SAMN02910456_01852 [Ruminococcaceae bacterium YRB3002]
MDSKKKIFWSIFSLVLAGLTIWAVLSQSKGISIGEIVKSAADGNKYWLSCAIVSVALYIILEGVAICAILDGVGYKRSAARGLLYSTSDIYFSAITPSATGGQPASAYFMIADGIPAGIATATLVLNLMMYTISVVVLGIISLFINYRMFFEFRTISKVLIVAGFIILTLFSLFFLSILRRGDKVFGVLAGFLTFLHKKKMIRKLEPKLKKLEDTKTEYMECSNLVSGKTGVMVRAFIWNFLQRASQIAVPAFVYLTLGGEGSKALSIFASQCLVTIGFNCVPVPGAMGVADFLMVDGFTGLIGRDEAFRVDMMSRGLSFYICVALSGIITLVGYIILKRRKKA